MLTIMYVKACTSRLYYIGINGLSSSLFSITVSSLARLLLACMPCVGCSGVAIKTKERLLVVLMNDGKMTIQMIYLLVSILYSPSSEKMILI